MVQESYAQPRIKYKLRANSIAMFILNETNSIANHLLADLRDVEVQNDREKFRNNLFKLGQILAYEISKSLEFKTQQIQTPIAETSTKFSKDNIVIISILRAAEPFANGFLSFLTQAEVGFVGVSRRGHLKEEIEADLGYVACPNLEGKVLIVVDPMLATGKSLVESFQALISYGKPKQVHLASVIASPEGVKYLKQNIAPDCNLWTCALDKELNEKGYIVPGLGDAGDLSFGQKVD